MTIATESFRSLVYAKPERVWAELTATGHPLDWLYGLEVESTWQGGTSIRVGAGGDKKWSVAGEVLIIDPPRRLSFALGDTPTDATVFVTWELAPDADRTILRLTIDETNPHGEAGRDIELAWLPVIQRLTALCGERATTAPKRPRSARAE